MQNKKEWNKPEEVETWISDNALSGGVEDYNTPTINDEMIPHLKLRWSMLTRAILDAIGHSTDVDNIRQVNQVKDEALTWILLGDDGTLCFNDVCSDLNLDAERVRRTIIFATENNWKPMSTQKPFDEFIINLLSL